MSIEAVPTRVVAPRRRGVGVSEHVLDVPESRARIEGQRGGGVSQRVGCGIGRDPRAVGESGDDPGQLVATQSLTGVVAHERPHGTGVADRHPAGPGLLEVVVERSPGARRQAVDPLAPTLGN